MSEVEKYDSTEETLAHIASVQRKMYEIRAYLRARSYDHDASKLQEPEKSMFDEFTPKLKYSTYGSDEYINALADMGPALRHHYEANSHHPEHFENLVSGMSLLDLLEMLADWKATSERHLDGDFARSIPINVKRFDIDPQLAAVLENTRKELGW